MKKYIILIIGLCIIVPVHGQSTYSKLIDLNQGFGQVGLHFKILEDRLLVFTGHNCALFVGDDPCASVSFFDFEGELQEVSLIEKFWIGNGYSSLLDKDSLFVFGQDHFNNNEGLVISRTSLNGLEFKTDRILVDTLNRYIAVGLLNFNNSYYTYGYYDDLTPGERIKGYVQKWTKGFSEELESWSYLHNGFMKLNNLQATIDSNLIFIAHENNAGPNSNPPLHIIKIDTLGNKLAEIEMDSRTNSVNLAADAQGSFYFNYQDSGFEYNLAKIDKNLDGIIWSTELPSEDLTFRQHYTVKDIVIAANGDILFCGDVDYQPAFQVVIEGGFVGRMTSDGDLLWLKLLSNENLQENSWDNEYRDSYLSELKELPNGNIVALGYAFQFLPDFQQDQDLWLLAMDANGCMEGFDCTHDIYELTSGESFPIYSSTQDFAVLDDKAVFPNPVADILHIILDDSYTYSIHNLQGQVLQTGQNEREINVHQLPKGIYFLQIVQSDKLYSAKKIIKQ